MPKRGYRSMTLPTKLYRELARCADRYGTTCPEMVRCLLDIMEGDASFDETFAAKVSENPVQSTNQPCLHYFQQGTI